MEMIKTAWRWWVDHMMNYESDIDFIMRMKKEEELLKTQQKTRQV